MRLIVSALLATGKSNDHPTVHSLGELLHREEECRIEAAGRKYTLSKNDMGGSENVPYVL